MLTDKAKEKLTKYKKLETKADFFLGKHNSECDKMHSLLISIIESDISDASVFYQSGDGYVLGIEMLNAPVDRLIKLFQSKGKKLNIDEVHACGI